MLLLTSLNGYHTIIIDCYPLLQHHEQYILLMTHLL